MTLNMLRTSRINPKLSAYTQLFGVFDYNKMPLAPLGTKAVIHERPTQRRTFGNHGQEGYYVGPAMAHYRHYSIFVTATRGDQVSNTVDFFPTECKMPKTSSEQRLTAAIEEITEIAKNPPKCAVPFLFNGNSTNATVAQLCDILSPATPTAVQPPKPERTALRVPNAEAATAPPPRVAAAPRTSPRNHTPTPRSKGEKPQYNHGQHSKGATAN
jgi:hypothetical protein